MTSRSAPPRRERSDGGGDTILARKRTHSLKGRHRRHIVIGNARSRKRLFRPNSHRLDQARVIVFDVSDPRAHRPARHLF